jgi:arsenite methyltransferase
MAVDVDIDVEVLKCEIKKTYARVSQEPEEDFIFPTGRAWILDLGNPAQPRCMHTCAGGGVLCRRGQSLRTRDARTRRGCPRRRIGSRERFARRLPDGGRRGERHWNRHDAGDAVETRAAAGEMRATNVTFVAGEAESLPFEDESFDVVISNGVIDPISEQGRGLFRDPPRSTARRPNPDR